jgi:hypothetical protein
VLRRNRKGANFYPDGRAPNAELERWLQGLIGSGAYQQAKRFLHGRFGAGRNGAFTIFVPYMVSNIKKRGWHGLRR